MTWSTIREEQQSMIESHVISFSSEQIAEIMSDVKGILISGQVILGKHTEKFEEEFAAACGREYGVAVGSDTAAFEIQLKTLGVKDKTVLYPALGFPSILESVHNAGAVPWFLDADIDKHLFCTSAEVRDQIKEIIAKTGEPPAALILMHTGGLLAADTKGIESVCAEYGVVVLEDAAHAFGATLDGRPAGAAGLSSAFSLYATKPMHACEGGMIVTDDEALATAAKSYRNYGRVANFGRSEVTVHGYSWRISEIQAAIGRSNLKAIGPNIARRRQIMAAYDELIRDGKFVDVLQPLKLEQGMEPNGYRYIVLLPEDCTRERRQQFKMDVRERYGIDLPGEVYELPSHKQPIWIEQYGEISMPVAEEFCARHAALPVYPMLTDAQVGYIVDSVGKYAREFFRR